MRTRFVALAVFAGLLGLALAQDQKPVNSFQRDFLISFNDVEVKTMSLAKAVPEEKYSWRPGEGVRSMSEVYVHIANGNRLLLSLMHGMPGRDAFMKLVQDNEQREKTIAGKAKVLADLEGSFKEVHSALDGAGEDALSKPIKFFGEDATPAAAYMSILEHVSEHLGQSIAYARMNGIVPPWSREQ
jgi:uncharacterized damage-inducible protein DinB